MYPQNDKIGVLVVPEIKTFFATQPWCRDLWRIFVRLFLRVLHWWYLYKVIEKR